MRPRLACAAMKTALILVTLLFAACADGTSPKPGPQGEMGEKGDPGDPGEMGTMGTMGNPGTAGQSCWDLNGNHTCDVATEDQNDDAMCDVGDCIGPAGTPGAPGAPGAAGTTGQGAISVFGTTSLTVTTATTTPTLIPGLTTTVNVPANSVVLISTDGGIATTSTAATGFSIVDVVVRIDGNALLNGGYRRVIAANTTGLTAVFAPWAMTATTVLAQGSHTIQVFAVGNAGASAAATVSGDGNSVNQGELSVVILKQ